VFWVYFYSVKKHFLSLTLFSLKYFFHEIVARFFELLKYSLPKNFFIMRSILYIVAVILIIGWLLGFFVYNATGLIHILLVIAVIAILLSVIRRA
jgi:hypothetical protein